jgi:cytochrome bd-type quinol oxidase subunit 1
VVPGADPRIFSFGLFVIVYAVLLVAYILFVRKIVRKGPETIHETSKTEGRKEDNFLSGLPKSIKITAN